MIAIDWGTSSLRAYRLAAGSARTDQRVAPIVLERREAPLGIMQVDGGKFSAALESVIAPWLDDGEIRIVMSGMIGSRQGWREAPYIECPADAEQIGAKLTSVSWDAHRAFIVPGLSRRDGAGAPDVMRGEETQIIGALDELGAGQHLICLPGTHSKWALVEDGCVASFTTHMTGEIFALLRQHSILARMMDEPLDSFDFFDRGVERARQPGGLLRNLFGVRALGLFNELPNNQAANYLSGLLIGHEIAEVKSAQHQVNLIGAPQLSVRYARALALAGREARMLDADCAVRGLWRIAHCLPSDERADALAR